MTRHLADFGPNWTNFLSFKLIIEKDWKVRFDIFIRHLRLFSMKSAKRENKIFLFTMNFYTVQHVMDWKSVPMRTPMMPRHLSLVLMQTECAIGQWKVHKTWICLRISILRHLLEQFQCVIQLHVDFQQVCGSKRTCQEGFKTMFDIRTDNPQFGESMIPNHRFYWHQQLFHIILENLRSVRLSNTDLSNNGLFCAFSPDCSKVTIFLLPQEMTLTSKIQHNDNFNEHNNSWRDSDKWNEAKSKWILQTAFR